MHQTGQTIAEDVLLDGNIRMKTSNYGRFRMMVAFLNEHIMMQNGVQCNNYFCSQDVHVPLLHARVNIDVDPTAIDSWDLKLGPIE